MSEAFTLYKLIVLYMLKKVDFPLTNGQISEFILEKGYTNYFTLQRAISEMVTAGLLLEESTHNRTLYRLTPEGENTISILSADISATIRRDVDAFIKEKAYELQNEVSVTADYYTKGGEYFVRCQIYEDAVPLLDLTVCVPTQKEASAIATNWSKRCQNLYAQIMAGLL